MELLLEEGFLKRLENLRFIFKGRVRGQIGGSHYSPRAGISLEFADYKKYFPGDDFRYVDWNIYSRLDKLLIKVFSQEEDFPIYILLDISRSMEVGMKLGYAVKLAAALSYLGLKDLNRVGVYPFAQRLLQGIPPRSGTRQISQIFNYLRKAAPGGQTSLNASLESFTNRKLEMGLVIIISDMFDRYGYENGLAHLLYKGFEVVILQLLAEEDLHPQIEGSATYEARLEDIEDGEKVTLYLGERARSLYNRRLANYLERLEEFCLQRGIERFLISTATPLEVAIFDSLRRGAFLK